MSSILTKKHCVPCDKGDAPLMGSLLDRYVADLNSSWTIVNDHHIEKEFPFKNFKEALKFTNDVGNLAEAENHHPDIHLSFGKVRVLLWTHIINGLSPNDFILASKIDALSQGYSSEISKN